MRRTARDWPTYLVGLVCLAVFTWSLAGFLSLTPNRTGWVALWAGSALVGVLLDRHPWWLAAGGGLLALTIPWWYRILPSEPQRLGQALHSSRLLVRDGWLRQVETVDPTAAWVLTGLGALLFAWALYRYAVRQHRVWIPLTAGIVWLSLQWIAGYAPATIHLAWFLVAGLTLLALASVRRGPVHSGFVSSRPSGNGVQVGISAVALLATVIISSQLVPQLEPTWHWGEVGVWVVDRVPALRQWQGIYGPGRGALSLASPGWGSSAQLGGPLVLRGRPMLRIRFAEAPSGPVYLREAALATYTGAGWMPYHSGRPHHDFAPEQRLPILVNRGSALRYTINSVDRPLWYLPVVYDVERLSLPVELDEHKNVISQSLVRSGREYTGVSRQPQVSTEATLAYSTATLPLERFATYLQLPDLPAEVRELVALLVDETAPAFAQAQTLERFLRERYPYELNVPVPPADQDFVAHFLFEAQSGYCSYHASALAVMLRIAGIPSRWVQGYRLDLPAAPTELDFVVNSDQAHAWVEAYFAGSGWVILEPTPAYGLPQRDHPAPDSAGDNAFWLDAEEWDWLDDDLLGMPLDDEWGADDDFGAPGVGDEDAPVGRFLWPGLVFLLSASALTVWGLWRDGHSGRGGVRMTYARALQLLARSGLPIRTGETPAEYAQRVTAAFPALAASWEELTYRYALVAYGPNPAEAPGGGTHWYAIMQALQQQLGKWRYLRARLLLAWDVTSHFRARQRLAP